MNHSQSSSPIFCPDRGQQSFNPVRRASGPVAQTAPMTKSITRPKMLTVFMTFKQPKCPDKCLGRARGGVSERGSTDNDADNDENCCPQGFIQYHHVVCKDLRAGSIPSKRVAAEGAKYYYFKGVKRGDVGQSYYVAPDHSVRHPNWFQILPAYLSEAKVEIWTKRTVFKEAKGYPRPPTHHHHCRNCNEGRNAWENRQRRRKMVDSILKANLSELLAEETLGHADALASSRRDYPGTDDADQSNSIHLQQVMTWKQYQVAEELVELAMERHYRRASHSFRKLQHDRISMAELSPTTSFDMLGDLSSPELSDDGWTLV